MFPELVIQQLVALQSDCDNCVPLVGVCLISQCFTDPLISLLSTQHCKALPFLVGTKYLGDSEKSYC